MISIKTKTNIKTIVVFPFIIPHVVIYLFSIYHDIISEDLVRWRIIRNYGEKKSGCWYFIKSIAVNRDFRTQFYARIGSWRYLMNVFFKGERANNIESLDSTGGGLVLVHAFGLSINGYCRIGKNCTILSNVTIGFSKGSVPVLGDNVYIGAGAILLGDIRIGNNVKIGAGAIVVEDIPDNCTVVGPKARIIEND